MEGDHERFIFNGTGFCFYTYLGQPGPDLLVQIPEDLITLRGCDTCGDVFQIESTLLCEVEPCDGLLCFGDEKYRVSYQSSSRCWYQGKLRGDCSDCDTECLKLCDLNTPENTIFEEQFVSCAYDLTEMGRTTTSLCSGSVPYAFCDDSELEGRTCYVAQVEDEDIFPVPALVWDNCAPIFTRVNDIGDYWACPMDSPVTGRVKIFGTTLCDEFAQSYGEPIQDGYPYDGGSNGASGVVSTLWRNPPQDSRRNLRGTTWFFLFRGFVYIF